MPTKGDNSDQLLKSYAERIAALMGQIKDIKDEVAEELKAAKSAGLDTKALNKVIREMSMDEDKRQAQLEFDLVVDDYRRAVGLTAIAREREAA